MYFIHSMKKTKLIWGIILSLILPVSYLFFGVIKTWILSHPESAQDALNGWYLLPGLISFVGTVTLPIGIFLLLNYAANKKGAPHAWYGKFWMLPLLLLLTFVIAEALHTPDPERKARMNEYRANQDIYDETIQQRLNEIEKEVTGLSSEGIECFNGKACSYMIIFHFNSPPSNFREILQTYTREFATLKQDIMGSVSLSTIRVQAQRNGNEIYECKSSSATESNPTIDVSCWE